MAARFIDTEIWSEDWFCDLGAEHQLFWNYIMCKCNNAGVWKPNKIDFEIKGRVKINMVAFLDKINERGCKDRIIAIDSGRWFITGFIAFQWFNKTKSFDLTLTNKLHKHIYELLIKDGIPIEKVRGLREVLGRSNQTSKDKVKDSIKIHHLDNTNTLNKENNNGGLREVLGRSKNFLIPQMLSVFKKFQPEYPEDEEKDFAALGELSRFILKQEGILVSKCNDKESEEKILASWDTLSDFISKENFFKSYSLSQISKHIQSIIQKFKNGDSNPKNGKSNVDLRSALEKLSQMSD